MVSNRARVLILALLLFLCAKVSAQTDSVETPSSTRIDSSRVLMQDGSLSDSIHSGYSPSQVAPNDPSTLNKGAGPIGTADSTQSIMVKGAKKNASAKGSTKTAKSGHSATKALCWSLLPGAGQVYNRQAWKIPIIYTGFAAVGYFVYANYKDMAKFKKEYLYRVQNDNTPQLPNYANYPTSNIYNLYQSYNKNFQLSIIIGVAVYALNLIDAYVFGHLFDYDIGDDISISATPAILSPSMSVDCYAPGVSFKLTF